MSFIEERLLDEVAFGFSGGPTWRTLITPLRNRYERRSVQASRPQHRFSGSFDRREIEIIDTLVASFNAAMGAAYGFRFKNWLDYQATLQPLGLATGVLQEIQLTKTYTFGSQSISVPIRKPNNDVVILADEVPTAADIDTTTGIATITAPVGSVLVWTGTFDIPVRFESDEFSATMDTWGANSVAVNLIEDMSA